MIAAHEKSCDSYDRGDQAALIREEFKEIRAEPGLARLRRRRLKELLVKRMFIIFSRIETVLGIFDGVGDYIF